MWAEVKIGYSLCSLHGKLTTPQFLDAAKRMIVTPAVLPAKTSLWAAELAEVLTGLDEAQDLQM